jgi:hypothetical protein
LILPIYSYPAGGAAGVLRHLRLRRGRAVRAEGVRANQRAHGARGCAASRPMISVNDAPCPPFMGHGASIMLQQWGPLRPVPQRWISQLIVTTTGSVTEIPRRFYHVSITFLSTPSSARTVTQSLHGSLPGVRLRLPGARVRPGRHARRLQVRGGRGGSGGGRRRVDRAARPPGVELPGA